MPQPDFDTFVEELNKEHKFFDIYISSNDNINLTISDDYEFSGHFIRHNQAYSTTTIPRCLDLEKAIELIYDRWASQGVSEAFIHLYIPMNTLPDGVARGVKMYLMEKFPKLMITVFIGYRGV